MSTKLIVDEFEFTVIERSYSEGRREWAKTTRVFGHCDLVPELMELEPFQGISLPYTAETDADKVRQGIWRAWRNGTTKAIAERLLPLLHEVKTLADLTGPVTGAKFSQKAGCSMCPCSPGMVLDAQIMSRNGRPVDMWIRRLTEAELIAADNLAASDHAIGAFV